MWSYRKMLKFSCAEKVKNEEELQRMNEKRKLINILRERKLRYFGHLIRLNNIQQNTVRRIYRWKERQRSIKDELI